MKQQAIQYLALDVHQATVVASLCDENGRVLMRATVPTEAKAILTLVRSASARVCVAFEEGTPAQWLHDLLIDHAERVSDVRLFRPPACPHDRRIPVGRG